MTQTAHRSHLSQQGEGELKIISTLVVGIFLAAICSAQAAATHQFQPTKGAKSETKSVRTIPATGILQAADLLEIAKLGSKGSDDQFSEDPTLKYVGREFSITIPSSNILSSYDKETGVLTLQTGEHEDGWELDQNIQVGRYYGQNSFGATALIFKRRGNIWGIEVPGSTSNRKGFTYFAKLDGSAARDLSKNAGLRITGKIKKADGVYAIPGSAVSKHSLILDATIENPTDLFVNQWFVAIEIDRADWIDDRTGTPLPLL